MIEKKEVIELIKSGFEPESIAFEFGLEIEQVIQWKKEIEQNRFIPTKNRPNPTKNRPSPTEQHLEIEKMRKKYWQLYLGDNRSKIEQPPKRLSKEETELVKDVLSSIEQSIEKLENASSSEKNQIAKSIYSNLTRIHPFLNSQLLLEQAKKFYELMHSPQIKGLHISNQIDSYMNNMKEKSQSQLSRAITSEKDATDSIEKLQELSDLITPDMQRDSYIAFGTVANSISSKIETIRQQMSVGRLKNNLPDTVKSIVSDLVNGEVDIQRATEIIDEEAKRRVTTKPKPKFGREITIEDERAQVFYQMSTAIEEKAETYPIKNPKKTIKCLQELTGNREEVVVGTVISNLIARKDFHQAKSICQEYIERITTENLKMKRVAGNNLNYIKSLMKKVIKAEISDIVMNVLQNRGTEEEKGKFKRIKELLEEENIKPSDIPLGTSRDGRRKITFADVFGNQLTR